MASLVPAHLKDGFAALLTGPRREREHEALPVIEWMEEEGRQLGFRVPSAAERARATGQEAYLAQLRQVEGAGFSDRDLFDWTGNHFDPDAVVIRILGAISTGAHTRAHTYLDPPAVLAGYFALRDRVARDGTAVQRQPVPIDLLHAFQHATDAAATTVRPNPVPADGDGGQTARPLHPGVEVDDYDL